MVKPALIKSRFPKTLTTGQLHQGQVTKVDDTNKKENTFTQKLRDLVGSTTAPSVSSALGATSGNASGNLTKKSSNMTQSASMANKTGAGNKTKSTLSGQGTPAAPYAATGNNTTGNTTKASGATTGSMTKAGQAASGNMSKVAGNVSKVGGGVVSNLSKAVGGGFKGLGNLISGSKK